MKKIADIEEPNICKHPSHNPPSMIVLKPGVYKHTCPSCGFESLVTVPPKASL